MFADMQFISISSVDYWMNVACYLLMLSHDGYKYFVNNRPEHNTIYSRNIYVAVHLICPIDFQVHEPTAYIGFDAARVD